MKQSILTLMKRSMWAGALCLVTPAMAQHSPAGALSSGPVSGMPHAHPGERTVDVATPSTALKGPEAARKTLEGWFRGFEFVPTAAHFARLGPDLEPALLALARSGSDPLVQARAISAMVHVRTEASRDLLTSLASDVEGESLLRRKAVLVLADQYGAEVLDLMVSVFESAPDDAPLREACARGLRAAGEAAMGVREALVGKEPVASVRALLNVDKDLR